MARPLFREPVDPPVLDDEQRASEEMVVEEPDRLRHQESVPWVPVFVYQNQRHSRKRALLKGGDDAWTVPKSRAAFSDDTQGRYAVPSRHGAPHVALGFGTSRGWTWAAAAGDEGWRVGPWEYATSWDAPFSSITDGTQVRRRRWQRDVCPPSEYFEHVSGLTPRELSRGQLQELRRGSEVSARRVDHLVILVHGVGEHGDAKMQRKQAQLEETARTLDLAPPLVAFEYVQWHDDLHSALDSQLDSITLRSIGRLRSLVRSTVVDATAYLGEYADHMRQQVLRELNDCFLHFRATHPNFSGKVSLLAHSLGSVISFDILTQMPGALSFSPRVLFCWGSPVPLFLTMRRLVPEDVRELVRGLTARGVRLLNTVHPCDAVAYRFEPLLDPAAAALEPVQVPSVDDSSAARPALRPDALFGEFPRVDFQLPPGSADFNEYLAALRAHRSYWGSRSAMRFVLWTLADYSAGASSSSASASSSSSSSSSATSAEPSTASKARDLVRAALGSA